MVKNHNISKLSMKIRGNYSNKGSHGKNKDSIKYPDGVSRSYKSAKSKNSSNGSL